MHIWGLQALSVQFWAAFSTFLYFFCDVDLWSPRHHQIRANKSINYPNRRPQGDHNAKRWGPIIIHLSNNLMDNFWLYQNPIKILSRIKSSKKLNFLSFFGLFRTVFQHLHFLEKHYFKTYFGHNFRYSVSFGPLFFEDDVFKAARQLLCGTKPVGQLIFNWFWGVQVTKLGCG